MELATALLHSAQRVEAPREGVEHGKPPLPGKRLGLPPEPEPQGGAVTDGYVAAQSPLLVVPSMAGGDRNGRHHHQVPLQVRGGGEEEEREEAG